LKPVAAAPARNARDETGRTAAEAIASLHAVAVVSDDTAAAGAVARGIATVFARVRRVIVADLVGNVPAVSQLFSASEVGIDGVSDSFAYGISLGKLTRDTPVANLFVLPSGDEPVEREEFFRSGRWGRLADQCRESGALLLVVARSTAPGLADLVQQLDGALLVGKNSLGDQPPFTVVHRIAAPTTPIAPTAPGRERPTRHRWPLAAAGALVLLLTLAAVFAAWRSYFPARGSIVAGAAMKPASVTGALAAEPQAPVANPGDSANAAAFAVEMLSANTREGANLELERRRVSLPVATIAPLRVGEAGSIWFRVIVGAYGERRQADSLLRATRLRGILGDSAGALVRAPLALLVDSAQLSEDVSETVQRHLERGVPAYALFQNDGRKLVYAGAFATAQEAEILAVELRAGGLRPVLVYRTGRAY
jgi:hypothetical protein